MSKKLLIEKIASKLKYMPAEKDSPYIGKLAGPGADLTKPTRNDRKYTVRLWRNVEKSEDFKEGLDTHTIFGEADHPEDRVDTRIKEVAMVLTEFDIRENDGIVYTEFGVLDTPNGRILKTLLDAGCKIGVSSRGLGDEIIREGETLIDEDTYEFFGFDAVVTPANKIARPSVIESSNKKPMLAESIIKEINNATTLDEVKSIERIMSKVKLPDNDSIKESLNIKLSKLGENISEDNSLELLTEKNEKLEKMVEKLKSRISANNIRIERMRNKLHESINNSRDLSKMLQNNKVYRTNLEESILDGTNQIEELETANHSLRDLCNKHKRIAESSLESKKHFANKARALENKLSKSSVKSQELSSENRRLLSEIKQLRSEKKSIQESYESRIASLNKSIEKQKQSRELTENKRISHEASLNEKLDGALRHASNAITSYLSVKCASMGVSIKTVEGLLPKNYTVEDIDIVVSELSDRKHRIDKVPVAIQPRTVKLTESNFNMSEEDRQTFEFLKATQNGL